MPNPTASCRTTYVHCEDTWQVAYGKASFLSCSCPNLNSRICYISIDYFCMSVVSGNKCI